MKTVLLQNDESFSPLSLSPYYFRAEQAHIDDRLLVAFAKETRITYQDDVQQRNRRANPPHTQSPRNAVLHHLPSKSAKHSRGATRFVSPGMLNCPA